MKTPERTVGDVAKDTRIEVGELINIKCLFGAGGDTRV